MSPFEIAFVIFIILINTVGVFIMGFDKHRAIKHKYRIPEKVLFFIAIIGGSIGIYLGMQIYNHKTKHKQFTLGIPFIILVQGILITVSQL